LDEQFDRSRMAHSFGKEQFNGEMINNIEKIKNKK